MCTINIHFVEHVKHSVSAHLIGRYHAVEMTATIIIITVKCDGCIG